MRDARGFSLVEVLVALFLMALAALAAAPLFVAATRANVGAGDAAEVGAAAVSRMEALRAAEYDSLAPGGSLSTNVAGYVDTTDRAVVVRWVVASNAGPTKTITVRAVATREVLGLGRQITLAAIRAR